MAPDLDVLIRSADDPLLFLEYHRQFTHALLFIPLGGWLCALGLWPFYRRHMAFITVFTLATVGYATHGLLDACTSYGTQLFWPLSNTRIAWDVISVVDPLFTLPLLLCIAMAFVRHLPAARYLACAWALIYLGLGFWQHERALNAGAMVVLERGHEGVQLQAKPSFGNILVWKTLYTHDDYYYVDAVRMGADAQIFEGESIARLNLPRDLPWLDPESQQAEDIERFRWFSGGFIAADPTVPNSVMDVRYSLVPNEIAPLWGIVLAPSAGAEEHVDFISRREVTPARRQQFLALLRGESAD
jgi:inner membrane protein